MPSRPARPQQHSQRWLGAESAGGTSNDGYGLKDDNWNDDGIIARMIIRMDYRDDYGMMMMMMIIIMRTTTTAAAAATTAMTMTMTMTMIIIIVISNIIIIIIIIY